MSRPDRHHKAHASIFALGLFNEYLTHYSLRLSYLGEKIVIVAEYKSHVTDMRNPGVASCLNGIE